MIQPTSHFPVLPVQAQAYLYSPHFGPHILGGSATQPVTGLGLEGPPAPAVNQGNISDPRGTPTDATGVGQGGVNSTQNQTAGRLYGLGTAYAALAAHPAALAHVPSTAPPVAIGSTVLSPVRPGPPPSGRTVPAR